MLESIASSIRPSQPEARTSILEAQAAAERQDQEAAWTECNDAAASQGAALQESTPGAVHEFADSQFGHVFGLGATREEARRSLVLSLSQMSVEGGVRTTLDILPKLLRLPVFVQNQVDTAWLPKPSKPPINFR